MKMKSTKWRLQIWIACFAILMNVLAPSISHALAAVRGDAASADICLTDPSARATPGVQAVSLLADQHAHTDAGMMEDCGYCLPHAGSYSLMPNAITGLAILGGHELRPFLFYRAPQPLLALTAAPPRGPPAIS
ncbi:DUF2946 domain-containing protein [Massilia sp. P8910]|uniref:DUF2946 domain-containing protein n=1 Tax=Massilia antarctica TaxID=2765360 RepID=UPI001E54E699|nr:DUF2946 domain-containing protein [Massilia antarctica]MCE3602843.1 DUF2946 domain-containing protein [Massilia antarctica]